MSNISEFIFVSLSLIILIILNYYTFVFFKKIFKRNSLKLVLSSAMTSSVIGVLVLDTFDLFFRIIVGLLNSTDITFKDIKMVIALHYIFELWIESSVILFLFIAIFSIISILIINKLLNKN